jgi:hypothetical protein
MVKRLQLLKDLRLVGFVATILTFILALFEVFVDGFTALFFIAGGLAVMMATATVLLHRRVTYYRKELKKIPREHRGHQDEPGSW